MTCGFDRYAIKGVVQVSAVTATMAALAHPADASFCSVFSRHPCAPSYCSPFSHRPCRPFYGFPLGENLQLTIVSKTDTAPASKDTGPASPNQKDAVPTNPDQKDAASPNQKDAAPAGPDQKDTAAPVNPEQKESAPTNPDQKDADHHSDDAASAHDVNTILQMFAALRACWQPPVESEAREGMQMSVRFSFNRDGKLKGPVRITYVSPDATPEAKQVYEQAINDTLDRCTPMQFSKGMAGAIAGRPIAVRFVDNRTLKPSEGHP
jgi:hypothetical protein